MLRRCGRCGQAKPLEDFAWRRIERGQRDNYCRPCRPAYKKQHYLDNKEVYLANAARRKRRLHEERVRWLLMYLADHPCVDCGERDAVVLEFDHLDGKSFDVAEGMRNRRWDDVLTEIQKCEVVCANCHRRRTARRLRTRRFVATHGQPEQLRLVI